MLSLAKISMEIKEKKWGKKRTREWNGAQNSFYHQFHETHLITNFGDQMSFMPNFYFVAYSNVLCLHCCLMNVYIYIILFIFKKLSQLSNLMNFTPILIFSPKFSPLYGYPWFRHEWILHALRILDIMFLKSPKEAVVFQRPELMKRSPVSFPTLRQNSE
jgi:hypothetical protein